MPYPIRSPEYPLVAFPKAPDNYGAGNDKSRQETRRPPAKRTQSEALGAISDALFKTAAYLVACLFVFTALSFMYVGIYEMYFRPKTRWECILEGDLRWFFTPKTRWARMLEGDFRWLFE
jgi:hypothetical protein